MAVVQIYEGLIKATEQIVSKFGKGILKEERFVNILQDLYPNRDNPAMFRIIKSMINDGLISDLLSCNKNNIQNFTSKTASALNKKYGYDKHLVEDILFSMSIGIGNITYSDYNALYTPSNQNQPKQKSKPSNYPGKKQTIKPSNKQRKKAFQPKSQNNKPSKSGSLYNKLYLSLAFLGLFISPIIYLLAITGTWWPSMTLLLILTVHAIIFSISYNKLKKSQPLPVYGGAFSAIILCAVIFIAFAPFYADDKSTKEVIYFLGISYNHEMGLPILTLPISLYYFGFINIGGKIAGYDLTLIIDNMTNKYGTGSTKINRLIKDKQFVKGFILSSLFIWLVGAFIMYLPTIDSWRKDINNYYLRLNREKEYKPLSFAGIILGSSIDSCVQMANNSSDYHIINANDDDYYIYNIGKLGLKDDFSAFSDSTTYIKTLWNNDSVCIAIHSLEGKIRAIDVFTDIFNQDSILEMFISKYGNPEYEKVKLEGTSLSNYKFKNTNYTDYSQWTFKNGIIKIILGNVRYIDRYLEEVASQEKKEKELKELERQKQIQKEKQIEIEKQRRRDSINRIKQIEYEKRMEKERNKAIEQI